MNFGFPNCRVLGETALVFEGGASHAMPLQRRLWQLAARARACAGIREAVTADGTLTVLHDRGFDRAAFIECMRQAWNDAAEPREFTRTIEIPIRYDGLDLETIARASGLDVDTAIALHVNGEYDVSFVGFMPGFAYLEGLDARLHVPRRTEPRARVAAGSVAIASGYTAVYPLAAPGGWNIVGTTSLRMFDPLRDPCALLVPGDRVRFVRV